MSGTKFSQVVAANGLVHAYLERVLAKLEVEKELNEIQSDIELLRNAIADFWKTLENYKRHPVSD